MILDSPLRTYSNFWTLYLPQAAIEEGVVVGGGCCLLRLSLKVDDIKKLLDNEEQKVQYIYIFYNIKYYLFLDNKYCPKQYEQIGADILKRALLYPTRQIAKNAGKNGNFVIDKVYSKRNGSLQCNHKCGFHGNNLIMCRFYQWIMHGLVTMLQETSTRIWLMLEF